MESISTPNAPTAAGHYSQAIVHNGVVYVAGQLPIDPKNRDRPLGSVEEQTEQTLRNIETILVAAGSSLDRVLQMTVYVTDISHWGAVNSTYARVMGSHKPARAIVPVKDLHYGAVLEIQAIAATK
jgi:2-iminobutanoate/2-iminopropanoate deaminase